MRFAEMGMQDRLIAGWRGAAIAALVALLAAILGLINLPALDRNESAFVQATVQMLESGDFVTVRYQDFWRGGVSPGAHWLQAMVVEGASAPEARAVWAYRLVSLFSIALAAFMTVWGGAALIGQRAAFIAGIALSVSLIVVTAGSVATADAPLLAACAMILAGFGRLYVSVQNGERVRRRDRTLFWAGLIAGVLIKGPAVLIMTGLAGAMLVFVDRGAPWRAQLGWRWGLIALAAFAGPWIVAVTVATDGAYWAADGAVATPPSPPFWQTALSPLLGFPLSALIPLAAIHGWRARKEPGVRVAISWLAAAWLVGEFSPQKQIFGLLPAYLALAWLGAAGLVSEQISPRLRLLTTVLAAGIGLVLSGIAIFVTEKFGVGADSLAGLAAAGLFAATGLATAFAAARARIGAMLLIAGALGVATPAWLMGVTIPSLDRLWPTQRIMRALAANELDPRKGLAVGPVAAAGYQEPSLIFALGASTETGGGDVAARAIADGRPAVVEAAEEASFRAALTALGATAEPIGLIEAYDYAGAREITVRVYGARPSSE